MTSAVSVYARMVTQISILMSLSRSIQLNNRVCIPQQKSEVRQWQLVQHRLCIMRPVSSNLDPGWLHLWDTHIQGHIILRLRIADGKLLKEATCLRCLQCQ